MATWFGGAGSFNNPNNWSPVGVPQSGDTAVVQTGTVKLANQTNGVTFLLEGASRATQPVLQLQNDALQGDIHAAGGSGPNFGKINVSGDVSSAGFINAGAAHAYDGSLTIHIAQQSTFENNGTMVAELGPIVINGASGAVFVNDGTVTSGFGDSYGPVTINTRVIGTGTFETESATFGEFVFGSSVASGLSVVFGGGGNEVVFRSSVAKGASVVSGTNGPQYVVHYEPLKFLASINNFNFEGTIDLSSTTVTSDTFANNHLKLFDNGTLVANLNIIGDFQTSQFVLTSTGGGTEITLNSPAGSGAMAPIAVADHSLLPTLTHG